MHVLDGCEPDLPGNRWPLGYTAAEAERHDNVVNNKCALRAVALPYQDLVLAVVEEFDVLGFSVCPHVELQGFGVVLKPICELNAT